MAALNNYTINIMKEKINDNKIINLLTWFHTPVATSLIAGIIAAITVLKIIKSQIYMMIPTITITMTITKNKNMVRLL